MSLMSGILRRQGVLTPEECQSLISGIQNGRGQGVRSFQLRTEIEAAAFLDCSLAVIIKKLEEVLLVEMQMFFTEPNLCLEFMLMTEMRPGDLHRLHADNERRIGNRWKPNHTSQRSHAAMLYLNSSGVDYEGGILSFPGLDVDVVPAAGELVAFPCGRSHEHEVTPVIRGNRYSVSTWVMRGAQSERAPPSSDP